VLGILIGDLKGKTRATLLAGGTPEPLIDEKAALVCVFVNGELLQGDKLDAFAEAFKSARDKKTPPPALKSLADLSK